jgi:hypothetical protein
MSKRALPKPDLNNSIMARVFQNGGSRMAPSVARQILKLKFEQADQDRIHDLLDRNREGKLAPGEKEELMEYVQVVNFLAILQSHARLALKPAGKAKA